MRKLFIILFVLFSFSEIGNAQPPHRYERSLKHNSQSKYLVHVPQNYDPGRKYPLLVVMHHKGGPATEQLQQWNFFSNRDEYIMLCPQFFAGFQHFLSDEDKKLNSMIHEMKEEFKYDQDKIFLVGFSLGADFVQKYAFKYPGRVAAAGILAARNYVEPPYSGKGREVKYFIGVGADDDLSADSTNEFAQQMKSKGYDVQFKSFPSTGYELSDDVKNAVMEFFKNIK